MMRPSAVKNIFCAALLLVALAALAPRAQAGACPVATAPLTIPSVGYAWAFDPTCRNIYVVKNGISVLSLDTGFVQAQYTTGDGPIAMDFSADGKTLYVANGGEHSISIIDLFSGTSTEVALPYNSDDEKPISIAAAANGLVLVATGYSNAARVLQYDPVTKAVTPRTGFPTTYTGVHFRATPDHRYISVVGYAPMGVYSSAFNSLSASGPNAGVFGDLALDATGRIGLSPQSTATPTGPSQFTVYEIHDPFVVTGVGPKLASQRAGLGTAVDAAGRIGYQLLINQDTFTALISVIDLRTAKVLREIDTGVRINSYPYNFGDSRLELSPDGSLLAFRSDSDFGLHVIATGNPQPQTDPLFAFSTKTAGGNLSFLRFHNTGTVAGTVQVTLADSASGKTLAQWQSPSIPVGAAPQFAVARIEAEATPAFTKPDFYLVTVATAMRGTFAHVVINSTTGTLTNFSTCGSTPARDTLANVHSSALDSGYPGAVNIFNTGTTAVPATLGLFDAANGTRLGTYTSTSIAPGAARTVSAAALEQGAAITANATRAHYVVKLEGAFSGYIQNLVLSRSAGVIADLSNVCRLP